MCCRKRRAAHGRCPGRCNQFAMQSRILALAIADSEIDFVTGEGFQTVLSGHANLIVGILCSEPSKPGRKPMAGEGWHCCNANESCFGSEIEGQQLFQLRKQVT